MLDLSICIPTLNASAYLHNCLKSIRDQTSYLFWVHPDSAVSVEPSTSVEPEKLGFELIVVDNASTDDTLAMLQDEFPAAIIIRNDRNEGFTHPINQALQQSQGRYMLVLNPDTIILPGAINELVNYMDDHPETGICGPKVLNRDGSLQKACKRGVSRPWAAFTYFSGLSSIFPHSKLFGGYLLNYLDENAIHEVDGVSGSCMLIRRQVVDGIGRFDEHFFAYQEDADYCFQAKKAGWKVVYLPSAQIIHFGGQGGSRVQPYRSIIEWHRSYYLYYRKNLARDYFFLFNWFYYFLMAIKLALSLIANSFRTDKFAGPRRV
ncbi:MAG TPA: glycosyltransferase family 2 protein [Anaerolineales bacterium]|nr:glycosyltransferase family 2 protein [Anaerolineales bacterium]